MENNEKFLANKAKENYVYCIQYITIEYLKKSENTFNLTNKSEIDIIKPSKERQLNKERNSLKCSRKFEKNFLNRQSVDVLIGRMRLT
ncbi:hypothetical protein ANBU17_18080 [Anaerostipes butyraticus]|uniref:Uncharacterized protein n=1 Tax=Anaerostipes butyraticus TaxID=645466 RepID=A0A916VD88_9FIRM|nr:hypothetical protein ANBU17_18080 [Anaerostipes butyraticus]